MWQKTRLSLPLRSQAACLCISGELLCDHAFELDSGQLGQEALGHNESGRAPATPADSGIESRLVADPELGLAGADGGAEAFDQVKQACLR